MDFLVESNLWFARFQTSATSLALVRQMLLTVLQPLVNRSLEKALLRWMVASNTVATQTSLGHYRSGRLGGLRVREEVLQVLRGYKGKGGVGWKEGV